jgi:hypothetical protein
MSNMILPIWRQVKSQPPPGLAGAMHSAAWIGLENADPNNTLNTSVCSNLDFIGFSWLPDIPPG